MTSLGQTLRSRAHPLHHLRRSASFRRIEHRLDVPLWARLHGIDWKVRVRLMRHLSYLLLREGPEPQTAALFRAIAAVGRPRTFWDVGANFGYYSWLLGSRLPELEAVLFEPDPVNVELIEATIGRAGPRFSLHAVAASSTAATAEFAVDRVSGATGTLERAQDSFGAQHWGVEVTTIQVPTVRLDDVEARRPVDLLKLDVEGHEEQALAGAERLLAEDRPVVVFEAFDGASPVFEQLAGHGYVVCGSGRAGLALEDENHLALPREREAELDELAAAWRRELS